MKVAIPHWQGRISPVFDVAGNVLLVEFADGAERSRSDTRLDSQDPHARAARLAELGADVLICGAISRPMEWAVSSVGIEVIPQMCGEVEGVLAAFLGGRLGQGPYLMPGCRGRRRRGRGRGRGARCGRVNEGMSGGPAE